MLAVHFVTLPLLGLDFVQKVRKGNLTDTRLSCELCRLKIEYENGGCLVLENELHLRGCWLETRKLLFSTLLVGNVIIVVT